jgi:hypothetical protein
MAGDVAPGGPWEALTLKGGRVLHHARVLSDEGEALVIRCDEGLVKAPKSALPRFAAQALAPAPAPVPDGSQMVMERFDPDSFQPEPEPEARPKPAQKPAPNTVQGAPREPSVAFMGCTIESFAAKPFQNSLGCAEVVIRNPTDSPVVIRSGDIVCVTAEGRRLVGRQIVSDGFPPVVKRREVVPPNGSLENLFTFSDEAVEIASMQWTR